MTVYRAEVSFNILVEAESEEEAMTLMRRHAKEECGNGFHLTEPQAVTHDLHVPSAEALRGGAAGNEQP